MFTTSSDDTAQSLVKLSVPGSGVPDAAPCHSRLVMSRLPDSRHASSAWNQVMQAVGCTPATETAYTPGVGGSDAGIGVQLPSAGNPAGNAGEQVDDGLSCVAPPALRSAIVALPF